MADNGTPGQILVFHKVSQGWFPGVSNYEPRRLFHLLDVLVGERFSLAPLQQVLSAPRRDRVAITFDDGYEHLEAVLVDLVACYHVRPTVFIPTAHMAQSNRWDFDSGLRACRHLDEFAIKRLAAMGVELGSHGHHHVDLRRLPQTQLLSELVASRHMLQDLAGQPVTVVSYPFGACSLQVVRAVQQAGFTHGLTAVLPGKSDSAFATGRIPVYSFDTPLSVLARFRYGPFRRLETVKVAAVTRLSRGTSWWQRVTAAGSRIEHETR